MTKVLPSPLSAQALARRAEEAGNAAKHATRWDTLFTHYTQLVKDLEDMRDELAAGRPFEIEFPNGGSITVVADTVAMRGED